MNLISNNVITTKNHQVFIYENNSSTLVIPFNNVGGNFKLEKIYEIIGKYVGFGLAIKEASSAFTFHSPNVSMIYEKLLFRVNFWCKIADNFSSSVDANKYLPI